MLKPDELNEFRQVLRMMQARILGDVEQLEEEAFSTRAGGDHGSSNHMAEMGSDSWDRDFMLRMAEKDGEFLEDISKALKKIDEGTFGLCEMCLEADVSRTKAKIPKARLRAIPYARNCVSCERKREEEN